MKLKQYPHEAIELSLSCDTKDDADEPEEKQESAKKEELTGKYDYDDSTAPVVFLFHSGYLSISSYDNRFSCYILRITNLELREHLAVRLTYCLTGMNQTQVKTCGNEMVQHLAKHEWQSFINTVTAFSAQDLSW